MWTWESTFLSVVHRKSDLTVSFCVRKVDFPARKMIPITFTFTHFFSFRSRVLLPSFRLWISSAKRECRNENVFLKVEVTPRKLNSHIQYYKIYSSVVSNMLYVVSVKFSLIESVICLFNDLSVETILFIVKSLTFHWSNQWNLTDSQ